jgi:hypothetical protein
MKRLKDMPATCCRLCRFRRNCQMPAGKQLCGHLLREMECQPDECAAKPCPKFQPQKEKRP